MQLQEKNLEEISQELKVFKDVDTMQFFRIFGPVFDPKLPLFANLFILRELRMYTN